MNLKDHIRSVPDFPKPGILFYDISTLLAHPDAWRRTVNRLFAIVEPFEPTILMGIESRGFLVAAPLALQFGLGFQMVRKKGKLPGPTVSYTYDLEYGYSVKTGSKDRAIISFGIRNIFDEKTAQILNSTTRILDQNGRVAYGSIKYQF